MKKLIILTIAATVLCGCQTRITAEKMPEQLLPVYGVSGTNTYIRGYERASGGWYATARSPLWATEELKGLSIAVQTNGTVSLSLNEYQRDLSTNAVTLCHNLVTDFAVLAEKAAAAYATCGASLATAEAQKSVQKAIASYILQGGNATNATVKCANGLCTFSDGNVCVGGNCSE